jgi:hypothetical protein
MREMMSYIKFEQNQRGPTTSEAIDMENEFKKIQ